MPFVVDPYRVRGSAPCAPIRAACLDAQSAGAGRNRPAPADQSVIRPDFTKAPKPPAPAAGFNTPERAYFAISGSTCSSKAVSAVSITLCMS
mgnify:FL=1